MLTKGQWDGPNAQDRRRPLLNERQKSELGQQLKGKEENYGQKPYASTWFSHKK